MPLPLSTYTKFNLKIYRALIHKDDCIKFYDSIKGFSPFTGRRITSIDSGYTMQRYDILLTEEELVFLKLQLSIKSSFYSSEQYDIDGLCVTIDECDYYKKKL